MNKGFFTLLFFCCSVISTLARGDFASALTAYQEKDYSKAFAEFMRLAELGDYPSQKNLAAMYANGQATDKNTIDAWAWLAIAAKQNSEANALRDKLFSRLSEHDKIVAQQRFNELDQHYGREALNAKLMPIPEVRVADCSVSTDVDAVPIKTLPPRYPRAAAQSGAEAAICFSFYLSAEGAPIRLNLVSSKGLSPSYSPSHGREFAKEASKAILSWRFTPAATESLREIPKRYCMDFKLMKGNSEKQEASDLLERYQADESNADVLFEIAKKVERNASTWSFAKKEEKAQELRTVASSFYLRSAINGNAQAQYRTASDLMTGNQCSKDPRKGIFWLTIAAQQGHTESQYLLGSRLVRGNDVQAQPEKGYEWLKAAADAGHFQAGLEYSLHLLRTGDFTNVEKYLPAEIDNNNIVQMEALAQIEAHRGNFDKAIEYQTIVVEIAKEIGIGVAERETVFNRFLAHQI